MAFLSIELKGRALQLTIYEKDLLVLVRAD
jgi:hypothetical protein